MIEDSFRLRYKNVPAAISVQKDFYNTPLHNHEEIEVLIIDKGTSNIQVGGKVYSCSSGDMVFVNPMEVHAVKVNEDGAYNQRCICFECSLVSDEKISYALKNGQLRMPEHIKCGEHKKLFELAGTFFDVIRIEDAAAHMEASAYASLIAAYMMKQGLLINIEHISSADKFCENVLDYVHRNYDRNITSRDVANELAFNQSYFCRRFQKSFGMSFSSYLNMYRVSIARRLLEDDRKSIADIAFECGFSDPMYFSKCFRNHMGLLPSSYRKKSI